MDKVIPFKEIGKVGKSLLVQIAGICQNYKEELEVEEIDFDSCPMDCPFQSFDIAEKHNICMTQCKRNRKMKKTKVVYMNERHKYNIKKDSKVIDNRLSKAQIIQLLSFHFSPVSSAGLVPMLSVKELSKRLGCTVRTIKNNNKRLSELDLIGLSAYDSEFFSVSINGYKDYHLAKLEGGTGYVQMTKDFFEALCTLDSVNSIRLAIRSLLKYDDEVEVKKKEECTYSYNDIQRFMPSNINHKKIIDELMAKTNHIFDFIPMKDYVQIKLKDAYNGKVQKPRKEEAFKGRLTEHIVDVNKDLMEDNKEIVELSPSEVEDLALLSMEYGVDLVVEGLKVLVNYIHSDTTTDSIENVGGFIRTVIVNNFVRQKKNVA